MKEKNLNKKEMKPWLKSALRVIIYVGIIVGLYSLEITTEDNTPLVAFIGYTFPRMMAFAISQAVYKKPKKKALGICSLITILLSAVLISDLFIWNIVDYWVLLKFLSDFSLF